jgi:hypothetical protein
VVGGVLVTNWDALQRILGTTKLTTQQGGIAILSAIALLVAWEGAKWYARQRVAAAPSAPAAPGGAAA